MVRLYENFLQNPDRGRRRIDKTGAKPALTIAERGVAAHSSARRSAHSRLPRIMVKEFLS